MFWGVLEGSCMDHEGSWGILGDLGGVLAGLGQILG